MSDPVALMAAPMEAALMEASWPPAQVLHHGPFTLRRGAGGGQRVSAATLTKGFDAADVTEDALTGAEIAMRDMGQDPLFMLTPQDKGLDQALAARGYVVKDPVVIYAADSARIAGDGPPPMTSFPHWPPMAIARTLWLDGQIGAERLAIMDRAAGPKVAVLGRARDRAAGVVFVALAGGVAFVHALHVLPDLRRIGAAQNLMRAAGQWAQGQGAQTLALAVTQANGPARTLYEALGMAVVGQYHYRKAPL